MSIQESEKLVSSRAFGWDATSMTAVHWLAAALAAITGTIHVYLYLQQGFLPFLFAAVVFYAAILGMVFNVSRRTIYLVGIPFTAGQIGLWAYQGMPDFQIGVADKVVQVALIVVLVYLFRNERSLVSDR